MATSCRALVLFCAFGLFLNIYITNSFANNLAVSNVQLTDRSPGSNTVVVQFDVSWENAWKTKINHDAVWLTARLSNPSVSPATKTLCQLTTSGLNAAGTSVGTNANLEIYTPSDKKGVFLRPSAYGVYETFSSEGVELTIDYSTCGFSSTDSVHVSVLGLEMVLVPEAAFFAGDYTGSSYALREGSADVDPWYIDSNNFISVTDPATNGYRYVSAGLSGEDASGTSFTIASSFPKGYAGFYAMKYEVTEGQWIEFINALPSASARSNHDLTDSTHKNTDTVSARNTISCSGSPLVCATSRPFRPASYLSWMNLAAFLDWAALRPFSELEFEKMSRGPVLPKSQEYVWGNLNISTATSVSGADEDGTESVTTSGANAHYGNTILTGGDAVNGPGHTQGPLRAGVFATATSTRESAGSSYYGVMDLSGNLKERVVTIGNAAGRLFEGTHGDGVLTTISGYEGYATNADWPGIDGQPTRGVTGSSGSGFRGGSWKDTAAYLRISDRSEAAQADSSAANTYGGRGVRTYED